MVKRKQKYGDKFIERLSKELTNEYGKGFDVANIKNMRQLYLIFPIRYSLRSELSWTHYRYIMRVSNEDARTYYINEAINRQLSVRELERLLIKTR